MKTEIIEFLNELEEKNKIKILYACETGVKSWNIPTDENDFEIRFIYVHNLDWYLSIAERKSSMEFFEQKKFDFVGWDLRKALFRIKKSEVEIFEWLNSSIIYKRDFHFYNNIKKISKDYFSLKTTAYHYINLAESIYEDEILGKKKVVFKSFIQAVRHLICAKWIAEQKEIPPIIFEDLLILLQNDINLMQEAKRLASTKLGVDDTIDIQVYWLEWFAYEIENVKALLDFLSSKKSGDGKLNSFFKEILLKDSE